MGPGAAGICSSSRGGSCTIAGGGPAGLMLNYLLARTRIQVLVLQKHADFLRDFSGDRVHPSTLETIYELGILQELLEQPHRRLAKGIRPEQVKTPDALKSNSAGESFSAVSKTVGGGI